MRAVSLFPQLLGEAFARLDVPLRLVHRGDLPCPITPVGLVTTKLQDTGDELGVLRGLDRRAVLAVLVSVIAERRMATSRATP